MTFQITDIPRLLPELMLLALALLVLGTDVLERWGTDAQSQLERGKAAGQLTVIGLGFVFIVALVQSKYPVHDRPSRRPRPTRCCST